MASHPAYHRRSGHDHVALFNYWDAWGAYGERGTPDNPPYGPRGSVQCRMARLGSA